MSLLESHFSLISLVNGFVSFANKNVNTEDVTCRFNVELYDLNLRFVQLTCIVLVLLCDTNARSTDGGAAISA